MNFLQIDRFIEFLVFGLMCDFLWFDFLEDYGNEKNSEYYSYNIVRGCLYFYR